jgi:hypothetical protein
MISLQATAPQQSLVLVTRCEDIVHRITDALRILGHLSVPVDPPCPRQFADFPNNSTLAFRFCPYLSWSKELV